MNNETINIRPVKSEDLDTVYGFICKLKNETLDYLTFKDIFQENLSNPNYVYFLADTTDETVGFISFHTQKLLHHCGTVGEIQEFYMDTKFRNQGIGRKLIQAVRTYAMENNLKSIEVTSSKLRTENVQVYEHLGFKLTHNKFTIYTNTNS